MHDIGDGKIIAKEQFDGVKIYFNNELIFLGFFKKGPTIKTSNLISSNNRRGFTASCISHSFFLFAIPKECIHF